MYFGWQQAYTYLWVMSRRDCLSNRAFLFLSSDFNEHEGSPNKKAQTRFLIIQGQIALLSKYSNESVMKKVYFDFFVFFANQGPALFETHIC